MDAPPVLIYDVECAFCQRSVRLLARLDRHARFRYSTRMANYGRALLDAQPWLRDVDSIILRRGDEIFVRSDAIIQAAAELGGIYRLAKIALLIPRPLRDVGYRAIARIRRKLAGEVCATGPGTEEVRARTLP